MRRLALATLLLALAGCVPPANSAQRLTEVAIEMNTATRFGRMDLALEHVGPEVRRDFVRRHAAWGSEIRVVDLEFGGFEMVGRDEAEVFVSVSWLRVDEATVRVTRISQRWRDERGRWRLVTEQREQGDSGLLGERSSAKSAKAVPADQAQTTAAAPLGASFQTRIIRGD